MLSSIEFLLSIVQLVKINLYNLHMAVSILALVVHIHFYFYKGENKERRREQALYFKWFYFLIVDFIFNGFKVGFFQYMILIEMSFKLVEIITRRKN